MLLNDPMLYGATLPYSEFPISSPYSTLFTNPWQQPNPWHAKQFQVTPYQMNPYQMNPWQVSPFVSMPWQEVPNYIPPEFGFSPYQQYQQYQNYPSFPMLQQVPPINPWLQRPTPFPQPIPFGQTFGLNRPFYGWQRPSIF